MTYDEIRFAWNAQADDEKHWNSLTEAEKVEWAAIIAAVKARGPAPIFRPEIKRKLGNLQGKGFRIVGYALEQSNSWTDNRRCTVDSEGLVRWMPSADQEVATERAARKKAQEEVVALKERIARAGVEHRRALHEALQQEREAFEKWLRIKPCGAAHDFGWEAWQARAALAATQPREAAPVELPESGEFQCRFKPDWDDEYQWTDWKQCTPESASYYLENPNVHGWTHEVRKIYTEQQVRKLLAAAKVERKPLTDEAIRTLYGESDGHWQMVGPQVLCFARSIESFHGITQEKQE